MLDRINDALQLEQRKKSLTENLNNLTNTFDVIKFLNDFVTFNGAFAGGVACCAGNIHRAMDMFIDENESIERCADRSSTIATRVFFAAEDEYNNGRDDRSTHREMAQKLIRSLATITDTSPNTHNLEFKQTNDLKNIISDVFKGYGVYHGEEITIEHIMNSLGFHIASELSADTEFNVVYKWLEEKHPFVLERLKNDNSHMWIKVHCSVEIEHFDSALEGVKLAMKYYKGPETDEELMNMFLDGIKQFCVIYDRFYLG